jgi:hypothetical protein
MGMGNNIQRLQCAPKFSESLGFTAWLRLMESLSQALSLPKPHPWPGLALASWAQLPGLSGFEPGLANH